MRGGVKFLDVLTRVLFVFLLFGPVHADNCDNDIGQTEMNQCAFKSFKQADQELNDAYGQLLNKYKEVDELNVPETERFDLALIETQRAWIKLRDTECHLAGLGTKGGSVQPMIISMCKDDLTRARVTWLRNLLTCQEGDLSCLHLAN